MASFPGGRGQDVTADSTFNNHGAGHMNTNTGAGQQMYSYSSGTRGRLYNTECIVYNEGRTTQDRRWLSTADPWTNHSTARLQHHPGTGEWLLQDERYKKWKEGGHLWLHGKPGCGKTVLCSTVIEDLKESGAVFAIYYFSFSDFAKQDYEGFLRSVVAQLADDADLKLLRKDLTLEILEQQLETSLKKHDKVYVAVDALDECHRKARQELLDALVKFRRWNVCLFMTSRFSRDIWSAMDGVIEISVASQEVDADIRSWMAEQMVSDMRLSRFRHSSRQKVEDLISSKSDGMFRWASLMLQDIEKLRIFQPAFVDSVLERLPTDLDATYERILNDVTADCVRPALELLRWVSYSTRPLTIAELSNALLVDHAREAVDPSQSMDIEDLLDCVSGLLTRSANEHVKLHRLQQHGQDIVDYIADDTADDQNIEVASVVSSHTTWSSEQSESESTDVRFRSSFTDPGLRAASERRLMSKRIPGYDPAKVTIQLAHFSVRSYLESQRNFSSLTLQEKLSHHILTRACVEYLLLYSCSPKTSSRHDLVQFPLLEYAAASWYQHALLHGQIDVDSEVSLLCNAQAVRDWTLVHRAEVPRATPFQRNASLQSGCGSALYYATFLGLEKALDTLLDRGEDPNLTGGLYHTPLQAASANGRQDLVTALLQKGADVCTIGGQYGTAWHAASSGPYEAIMELLVANGALTQPSREFHGSFHGDSGYGTGSYGSQHPGLDDDNRSIRSDGTTHNIPSGVTDHMVEELIAEAMRRIMPRTLQHQPGAVTEETIAIWCRSCAIMLRNDDTTGGVERGTATFLRHRRKLVATRLHEAIQDSSNSTNHDEQGTISPIDIQEWMRHNDEARAGFAVSETFEEHEPATTSDDLDRFQDVASNEGSMAHNLSDEGDQLEVWENTKIVPPMYTPPRQSDNVVKHEAFFKHSAFRWLSRQVRIAMTSQGTTTARVHVQTMVSTLLDKMRPGEVVQMSLRWNPRKFLAKQYFGHAQARLRDVLVYCGEMSSGITTTIFKYAIRYWPRVAKAVIMAVENACKFGTYAITIEKVNLLVHLTESETQVHVQGVVGAVAVDILDLCAWIALSCRASPTTQTSYSQPYLRSSQHEWGRLMEVAVLEQSIHEQSSNSGCCWLPMVKNPVITRGYPIPCRSDGLQGMEMSFPIMVALGRTEWASHYCGVFVLKRTYAALVPVAATAESVQWHFVHKTSDLKGRLTFNEAFEAASEDIDPKHLINLESKRHYVGLWSTEATFAAESNDHDLFPIEHSGDTNKRRQLKLSLGASTISAGKILTIAFSVLVGDKDTPVDMRSTQPVPLKLELVQASESNVLLYSTDDMRGWLIDGASATMHLTRSWIYRFCGPSALSGLRIVHDDDPRQSAIQTLLVNKHISLNLGFDSKTEIETDESLQDSGYGSKKKSRKRKEAIWTVGTVVQRIWFRLTQLIDRSHKLRTESLSLTINMDLLKGPFLTGWQAVDVTAITKSNIEPSFVDIDGRRGKWQSLALADDTVTLFAKTFGEMIRPRSRSQDMTCQRSLLMPVGTALLAAPLYVLKTLARAHRQADLGDCYVRLSENHFWYRSATHIVDCEAQNGRICRCDIISGLRKSRPRGLQFSDSATAGCKIFDRYPRGVALLTTGHLQLHTSHGMSASGRSKEHTPSRGVVFELEVREQQELLEIPSQVFSSLQMPTSGGLNVLPQPIVAPYEAEAHDSSSPDVGSQIVGATEDGGLMVATTVHTPSKQDRHVNTQMPAVASSSEIGAMLRSCESDSDTEQGSDDGMHPGFGSKTSRPY